jgi:hypothetical protein
MVLEYTTDLEAAASLELFDIHLMHSFEKTVKKEMDAMQNNIHEDDEVPVPADSFTATYFVDNLFKILNVPDEDVFTNSLDFKPSFARTLAQDNIILNSRLEKFKSEHIKGLSNRANFVASVVQFTKWVDLFVDLVQKFHYHAGTDKATIGYRLHVEHLLHGLLSVPCSKAAV